MRYLEHLVYTDQVRYQSILAEIFQQDTVVNLAEVDALHQALLAVAAGEKKLLHIGECVECFSWIKPGYCQAQFQFFRDLKSQLSGVLGQDVVLVGRMAGQFFKPRSQYRETISGQAYPVYRGDGINGLAPSERQPCAQRLLRAAALSREYWQNIQRTIDDHDLWISHEALHIDYEQALTRVVDGQVMGGSAHLPWLGMRAAFASSQQSRWLARIVNPVAIKVGPRLCSQQLISLLALLNPQRIPGKITLIYRLSLDAQVILLPKLFHIIRSSGQPVLWCCDPLHGNTVKAQGRKSRSVKTIMQVISQALSLHARFDVPMHGLHLEATSRDVYECEDDEHHGKITNRSVIDPMLNVHQARALIYYWGGLCTEHVEQDVLAI